MMKLSWITWFYIISLLPDDLLVMSNPDIKVLHFKQPVDHFGYSTSDHFLQRYLVIDEYWSKNEPIFFYTGNEGDIFWFLNNTGLMLEWAPKFRAMIVFAEHRYYGDSLPYGPDSFKDLNHVGYLTSEQAIADFVHLIHHIKVKTPGTERSPVVAFGGSYGGMLAAWLRMKYPHTVVGSLASSAPIWMFGSLVPCSRYNEIVSQDFSSASPQCMKNIRRSWSVIDNVAKTVTGRQLLTKIFTLCEPIDSADDVKQFKSWLSDTWSSLAMVDYPYAASFLEPLPAWPIKVVCSHLLEERLSDVELLQHMHDAVGIYYNFTGSESCFNTSQSAVSSLGTKAWSFQQCTEMVMPMCSNGVTDMFELNPWNYSQYILDCHKSWNVTPRPGWILQEYGGMNITAASNIIFSNGDLDPWSAGGVLTSPSPSLHAIVIKDGAHHLDLRSSHPLDISSVVAARSEERDIIYKWIQDYYEKLT